MQKRGKDHFTLHASKCNMKVQKYKQKPNYLEVIIEGSFCPAASV